MLIKRLELKKLLSFRDSAIELGQLNVLIGPNAVGKSNLIEVIGLLQAASREFRRSDSSGRWRAPMDLAWGPCSVSHRERGM